MYNLQERGYVRILLLLVILGIIVFLAIASNADFKDKLFSALYPKDSSYASTLGTAYSPKVLLLIYNPIIESQSNQRLTQVKGWDDPIALSQSLKNTFPQVSGSLVNFQIAETVVLDDYPVKADGFTYDDESYLSCVNSGGSSCHNPDSADYTKMLETVDACGKRNRGEIDEVWIFGGPWFGFWESNLTGPGAYNYNSGPTLGTTCEKLLPIMGLNYERHLDAALHSFGHRVEATMTYVYGKWNENDISTNWNKFGLVKAQSPNFNYSGCGSIHFPPNATTDYEYGSTTNVNSNCDDFSNYPNLLSTNTSFKAINCQMWGCSEEGYMKWWFGHLPRFSGVASDGKQNNWWSYVVNPQLTLPSDGTFTALSAGLYSDQARFNFAYSGTSNAYEIDMSSVADMSSDVYLNFASGNAAPVVLDNPQSRWDKYRCGNTLYWRIYNQSRTIASPIQSSIICSSTPPPTFQPTPTPVGKDTINPKVAIISPADRSILPRKTTVLVQAQVSDNVGINKVEFLRNGYIICTDKVSPYSCSMDTDKDKNVTVKYEAKAYDLSNNLSVSSIKITTK